MEHLWSLYLDPSVSLVLYIPLVLSSVFSTGNHHLSKLILSVLDQTLQSQLHRNIPWQHVCGKCSYFKGVRVKMAHLLTGNSTELLTWLQTCYLGNNGINFARSYAMAIDLTYRKIVRCHIIKHQVFLLWTKP